jgi:hypothetical protein
MHTDSDIPNLMLQGVAKVGKRVAFNRAAWLTCTSHLPCVPLRLLPLGTFCSSSKFSWARESRHPSFGTQQPRWIGAGARSVLHCCIAISPRQRYLPNYTATKQNKKFEIYPISLSASHAAKWRGRYRAEKRVGETTYSRRGA